MKRFFTFILLVLMICGGCRSRKETHVVSRSDLQSAASLEARRLDSVFLSKSIGYRLNIDFYPPQDSALPMNVSAIQAESGLPMIHGAVRRVTVETERNTTATHAVSDTMAVHQREVVSETHEKTVEKEAEKGQNLPWLLAIAAFAAAMICLFNYRRNKV